MAAVQQNNVTYANKLRMEIGMRRTDGTTALMLACLKNYDHFLDLLLEKEGDIADSMGCTL